MREYQKYICDIRVGCVAVYQEPKVNCIDEAENVIYSKVGKYDQKNQKWELEKGSILAAKKIADELNKLVDVINSYENK